MAGPINGIGGQQQLPISNTFQPGQENEQVRQQENAQPNENTVQPQGAAPANIQNSETGNENVLAQQNTALLETGSDPNAERGSILDIEV